MQFRNTKLSQVGFIALAMLSAHCSGNSSDQALDGSTRAAAVARMQPLVKTVANYADTLSVAGEGQPTSMAIIAANTLSSALVPGTRMPVEKVARAIKSARDTVALPDSSVQTFLNSRVFTAANVESVNGDTTTYVVHGDTLCADPNATDPNAGANCAADIDKLAIHVVVTSQGQDQNIAVQIGNSTDSVFTAKYTAANQGIAVDVDLAQAQSVLSTLNANQSTVSKATGHIDAAFSQAGTKQASVSFGFAQAVTVTSPNSSLALGVAPQAFTLSANDTVWTMAMNVGSVDLSFPATGSDGNSTTTLTTHLAGVTAKASGDASSQGTLMLQGLGLGNGPATLTQNGQVLVQAEINAASNHTFDVTVGAQDSNGSQPLSISPALNITMKAAMQPVAAQVKVPQELLNNNYSLSLSNGSNPVAINLLSGDLVGLTDGSLQVVSGQLVLTSDQGNVTVPAGQCLAPKSDATAGPSWVTEQQAASCDYGQDTAQSVTSTTTP